MDANLESDKCIPALSATAPCTAFQVYPVYNTILRPPHLSQIPYNSRGCIIRTCRPKACFQSDSPRPERSEQVSAHGHQPQPPSLPSSEFAIVLTLIVTAAAGGPALAAWGVFFLILGKTTGTPHWLQALSTLLFASITDTLSYNWTTVSFDTGYTPFVVFLLASGAATVYESAPLFPSGNRLNSLRTDRTNVTIPGSPKTDTPPHRINVPRTVSKDDKQFANWDHAFREAHNNEDADH